MSHLHKIAGSILGKLNSFKGSRPALDNGKILIVRSIGSDKIDINNIDKELDEIVDMFNGDEIEIVSDDAGKIINRMDEQVRSSVKVNAETDSNGIMRMVKGFEDQGITTNFRLFDTEHASVFVVLWRDHKNMGPCFVEVTVSDKEV